MQKYQFVRHLKDLGKEDLSLAGGKGANLGEMIRAGLPVPEGFVVLVEAYRKFVAENKLEKEIITLLSIAADGQSENLKDASERVKKMFVKSKIPAAILKEIDDLYVGTGKPPVAVRSSATAEDLPGASFAGQYSTFLNIKGEEELHEAIKKCWASLWNERAISYRAKQNIISENLAHGVVVQKLITSEKSGILFTANPVNGRRDQLSLSSSWGLGEAIVSGEVDPDQWVIDKKTGETVSAYIAEKKVMTVRKVGGTELVSVEPRKQKEVTLDEAERKELLDMALKVEEYFKSPQDLEWAFEEGRFYLVQTRPITALYPMPQPEDPDDKLHVYINMSLYSHGMHELFTPLAVDMLQKMYLNFARRINWRYYRKPAMWIKSSGGRLFFDITGFIKSGRGQHILKTNKRFDKDPETIKIILNLLENKKDELKKSRTPLIKSFIGIITKANPWIIIYIITAIPKLVYGLVFPKKAVYKAFLYGNSKVKKTEQDSKKLQTREKKLEFIEQRSRDVIGFNSLEIMFYGLMSLTYTDKVRKIISKHGLDISEVDKVERAVPNSVTTEMGMEMLRLAKNLDQAGEKPSADHPEIRKFLEKYGHRSCREGDIGFPNWKEDPGYVVNLIQLYIDNNIYNEGIERFSRDMEEADQAIDNITAHLRGKGARRDTGKVEKLLKNYRESYGIRELPKFLLLKAISLFREILVEMGEELVEEGRLEHKDDIFMVTFQDIKKGEELQGKARQSREDYIKEMQRSSVPRVMTSTGESFYWAKEDENDIAYSGIPLAPGICKGAVKVVNHPQEGSKLKQGDIMVAVSTNPAWTPLFLIIGGLILETGGPISHGAVVAREYGIPAVVGVRDATTRLKDGQRVRINGETGAIKILNGD